MNSCLRYFLAVLGRKTEHLQMKTKIITFDRFVRILATLAISVAIYFLIRRLSGVLMPFLIAWLVAYIFHPIVTFFQQKCRLKSRVLSIIVTFALFGGIITGVCYFIVPYMIEETSRLKDIVVSYVSTEKSVSSYSAEVEDFIKHNIDLNAIVSELSVKDVSQFAEDKIPKLFSFIGSGVSAIIKFVCSLIAVIYMFFILKDFDNMSAGVIKLVPKSRRKLVQGVFADVKNCMNAYFRGQTLIAACVGVLFAIGFYIIGLPLAIPLGLFIGMLNLVPYLQVIGFIPTVMLALLKAYDSGQSFWTIILYALAVFAIVQAIQDWVLTPRIMGKMTGLNAAVILLSLSVWGSLLGFIGLIIALPLTTLIISYYKRFVIEDGGEGTENAGDAHLPE